MNNLSTRNTSMIIGVVGVVVVVVLQCISDSSSVVVTS